LLLDILPLLNDFPCFALKGGTAINLFIRNLPRLSVDIDLTYLPIEARPTFLNNYTQIMHNLREKIHHFGQGKYQVREAHSKHGNVTKLIVHASGLNIKIEPNLVMRGSVNGSAVRKLCPNAENQFLKSISVQNLSLEDIYAGKICAALNRQHPRDLFDVKLLFEHEGLTDEIRKTFVVYLAGDSRPMAELLDPNLLDIEKIYENEFKGMTHHDVSLNELLATRKKLIYEIQHSLTLHERQFLLSMKEGEPNWSLLQKDIKYLPSIQWKLQNIKKMDKRKHQLAVNKLRNVLAL
jgi:predicted nucleotidyltransferase component of viral defense system